MDTFSSMYIVVTDTIPTVVQMCMSSTDNNIELNKAVYTTKHSDLYHFQHAAILPFKQYSWYHCTLHGAAFKLRLATNKCIPM